jgi:hypothetical protein
MPGSTKGAVVLLWILFGLGICGSGALAAGYFALTALEDQGDVVIPSSYVLYLVVAVVQAVIWTVLRAVFAVKIARRSAGARKGAVIFEIVNVGLSARSTDASSSTSSDCHEMPGRGAGASVPERWHATILVPSRSSRSTRWLPAKPEAPVTSTGRFIPSRPRSDRP